MVNKPILAHFPGISQLVQSKRPTVQDAFRNPGKLPTFVSDCPPAMRLLDLLGPLSWADFPERNLHRNWGQTAIPYAAFSAACPAVFAGRVVCGVRMHPVMTAGHHFS